MRFRFSWRDLTSDFVVFLSFFPKWKTKASRDREVKSGDHLAVLVCLLSVLAWMGGFFPCILRIGALPTRIWRKDVRDFECERVTCVFPVECLVENADQTKFDGPSHVFFCLRAKMSALWSRGFYLNKKKKMPLLLV